MCVMCAIQDPPPLLEVELIIMPLHVGKNHWICVSMDMRQRIIKVYDSLIMVNTQRWKFPLHSLLWGNQSCTNNCPCTLFLQDRDANDLREVEEFDVSIVLPKILKRWEAFIKTYIVEHRKQVISADYAWKLEIVPKRTVPQQDGGIDCGIYAIM